MSDFLPPFFPLRNSVRSVYFVLTSAAFRFTWNPSLQNESVPNIRLHPSTCGFQRHGSRRRHSLRVATVGSLMQGWFHPFWEWGQRNEPLFWLIILARFAVLIYPSCTFTFSHPWETSASFACGIIWWPFREPFLNPESSSFGGQCNSILTCNVGSLVGHRIVNIDIPIQFSIHFNPGIYNTCSYFAYFQGGLFWPLLDAIAPHKAFVDHVCVANHPPEWHRTHPD